MWDILRIQVAHAKATREHHRMVDEAIVIAGEAAAENVRTKSSFKRRGIDSLKDNTRHRMVRVGAGRKLLRLTWDKKYAAPIDKGAVAHEIVARNAPYLRFYWPRVGHWVSLKKVNHPGNRPFHFGFQAQKVGHQELGQRLRFGMRRVSSKFR